jgi:cellulose synthase/poly-beta-1,6-N-acetylglucosamine synthase-like glycosyltransferase
VPATVPELLQQRRRWSYGTTQVTELHRHRMLLRSGGRLGLIGLPWLTLSQVILPALGPVVDLFLVWLVLNGDWAIAAGLLALAMAMDAVLAAWALRSEGESLRFLLLLPAARFLWRPLMGFAIAGSLRSWLLGRVVGWNQATRHNTARRRDPARSVSVPLLPNPATHAAQAFPILVPPPSSHTV